jgi:hypothetical protein
MTPFAITTQRRCQVLISIRDWVEYIENGTDVYEEVDAFSFTVKTEAEISSLTSAIPTTLQGVIQHLMEKRFGICYLFICSQYEEWKINKIVTYK